MFKENKKYYYVLAAIFISVLLLQYFQPKPIDWRRTYSKNDKIPFGCFAIYNLLDKTFTSDVNINQQTLYMLNNGMTDSLNTVVIVNDKIDLSSLDVISLFKIIEKGNTVLLCGNDFSKKLQDTFKLKTQYNYSVKAVQLDSLLKKRAFEIRYVQQKNNLEKSYHYPQIANETYFSKFDTALFKVSSINANERPVLLEAKIGTGKLLISSLPDIFGNLFIVDHKNRLYSYTLLSKLKNETIIWDEFYKTYNVKEKGLFQFIFNNDALYTAYLILILGLLFFMIFEMKRKQRPIPVITPLKNSTLEFVDVISHVYFNSKNHKHIAQETIQYFYFYVRRKFQVNTVINDEFFTILHKLSEIDYDEIKRLFTYCENLKGAPSLTQYDLLELNSRINSFKQKNKRQ